MQISESAPRRKRSNVIDPNIPHLVPDGFGGTYVIRGDHGWVFGRRPEALAALRELAIEERR